MAKINKEKFKTYKDVFDEATLRVLFELSAKKYFDELKSPISIGKESNVFSAVKGKKLVVVKIYRVNTCDFKRMYKYIRGDNRFAGLRNQKRKVIYAWAQREYRNLIKAHEAGVSVPKPIAVKDNVLVMEYIGGKWPAKILKVDIPADLEGFLNEVFANIEILYKKAKLIHADLSEFNVLNFRNKPVLIDLSHSMPLDYAEVEDLLKRDIHNIVRFGNKFKINFDEKKILEKIKNVYL